MWNIYVNGALLVPSFSSQQQAIIFIASIFFVANDITLWNKVKQDHYRYEHFTPVLEVKFNA